VSALHSDLLWIRLLHNVPEPEVAILYSLVFVNAASAFVSKVISPRILFIMTTYSAMNIALKTQCDFCRRVCYFNVKFPISPNN